MKQGESYIRDRGDFLAKLKAAGEVPEGAILVPADVVGIYSSIPHSECLDILKKQYENYPSKKISIEGIVKMADFVLKNSLFEVDSKFYKQISGRTIGTKFASPYAYIFMDHIEKEFLKTQYKKLWFCIYVYIYKYVYMCICIYVYLYAYICMCVYICLYMLYIVGRKFF